LTPTNQFAAKFSSQVVILKLHRNFTTTNNSTAAATVFFYQIGQFLDSEVPPFYNLERSEP
jgi:hypothetical protein